MNITRRKMFAGLGLLPVAMLPTTKTESDKPLPVVTQNVMVSIQNDLVHEVQFQGAVVKAVMQGVKRGQISFSA